MEGAGCLISSIGLQAAQPMSRHSAGTRRRRAGSAVPVVVQSRYPRKRGSATTLRA